MFALGADPDRIAWGIQTARDARKRADLDPDGIAFGAYVNAVVHDDRGTARELVSGGLTTFARFAVMHGRAEGPFRDEDRQMLGALHGSYDMRQHTRSGSPQTRALTPGFVDRYAAVGPAREVTARLRELAALGLGRLVVIGPSAGSDRESARRAVRAFAEEVLPAFAGAG
jgi:5,10-methylenetetrahydromethanopterin reductase